MAQKLYRRNEIKDRGKGEDRGEGKEDRKKETATSPQKLNLPGN